MAAKAYHDSLHVIPELLPFSSASAYNAVFPEGDRT